MSPSTFLTGWLKPLGAFGEIFSTQVTLCFNFGGRCPQMALLMYSLSDFEEVEDEQGLSVEEFMVLGNSFFICLFIQCLRVLIIHWCVHLFDTTLFHNHLSLLVLSLFHPFPLFVLFSFLCVLLPYLRHFHSLHLLSYLSCSYLNEVPCYCRYLTSKFLNALGWLQKCFSLYSQG